MSSEKIQDIVIVGGGYTGAAAAIHLSRMATRPLAITAVEPRGALGRGVAYDTGQPEHRLNINPEIMILYLDDIDHFPRYLRETRQIEKDPAAPTPDGMVYVRRSVFGEYMAGEVAARQTSNPSGSTIMHLQDRAVSMEDAGNMMRVITECSGSIAARTVLLCPSHGRPALPGGLDAALAGDPRCVVDPWDNETIGRIGLDDRLLILGTGLTAGDVLATVRARGHRGSTLMLSRHGLYPRRQNDLGDVMTLIKRISRPVPDFIERHGQLQSVAEVVRAVRRDISAARAADPEADWRDAFDHVRDAGGAIWRGLPNAEKRRYVRHLKTWYEAHRNRLSPQVMTAIETGLADGSLNLTSGRVMSGRAGTNGIEVTYRPRCSGEPQTLMVDAIVNCTGPAHRPEKSDNPLIDSALAGGFACADRFGLGLEVDDTGRSLYPDGRAHDRLFIAGPLTRGRFGDIIAVAQITVQLQTVLPAILSAVDYID